MLAMADQNSKDASGKISERSHSFKNLQLNVPPNSPSSQRTTALFETFATIREPGMIARMP
jgi:hypothetical protein